MICNDTGINNFFTLSLLPLLHPVIDGLLLKKKHNKQIKVYLDETNKIAFIAPQKKVSDRDIEEIHQNIIYSYDEVIMVSHDVIFKGAYHKEWKYIER